MGMPVAAGRTDLRHLPPLVTIDPPDAKDDDAVCLVEENGQRTLWVAIAVALEQAGNFSTVQSARTKAICFTPCFRCSI